MRVSQAEKEKSRERIIASAARLLRERGIENTSVADVMGDAGLTHGGFYRHFDNKEAMVCAALDSAFDQVVALLDSAGQASDGKALPGDQTTFGRLYLSEAHVRFPGGGCPVAALAGDVGRTSEDVRESFAQGVRRVVWGMARRLPGSKAQRKMRAYRQLAMMAGAVAIARASDPETAAEVLSACRQPNV